MVRIHAGLVGLVMLATVGIATPTLGGEPRVSPTSSGARLAPDAQARALAYWTEARMGGARAARAPVPPRRSPRTGISDEAGSRARLVEGSQVGDTSSPAGETGAVYEYPYPYTRYGLDSVLYSRFPFRTVGKIFFRRGGVNRVCSGASVVGGPRHIVFTAGHCLNNGSGAFSGKVVFVPAYRDGNKPYGSFPATLLWVLTAWGDDGDSTYDYGAFSVGRNAAGRTLGQAVGELGFMWDAPRDLHWSALGYPADPPFDGETMHVCHASRAVDDIGLPGFGAAPIGIGCDLTGGSSGGPWIYRLKRGNYLNSVISYGYDETEPEGTYGPYLDASANLLRCAAATGNPEATDC